MSLETIYYIGQTIAVAAILASLVAIYVQQRKDHAFAKAESQREILQQGALWYDEMIMHQTGLESVRACLQDFRAATPRQQVEFSQYMTKIIMLAEQAVWMQKNKLIEYNSYVKFVMLPALHFVTPGGQEYWADLKPAFSEDVATTIDKILEESPPSLELLFQFNPYFRPEASEDSQPDASHKSEADQEPGA